MTKILGVILGLLIAALVVLGISALFAGVLWFAWTYVGVAAFGWPALGFWQVYIAMTAINILLSALSGRKSR